ncbi:Hypothetical predicted protein [Olea europaea subsp. europaea]|uniref:Uncharacterized protein n=2 Tax=Olea europaea subsp. europaea TaxID=158383 RepID=A0A8S0RCK8_OLEEU|nr:Hypothetical predicted protein [Olea europaea subsp. europaea]
MGSCRDALVLLRSFAPTTLDGLTQKIFGYEYGILHALERPKLECAKSGFKYGKKWMGRYLQMQVCYMHMVKESTSKMLKEAGGCTGSSLSPGGFQ